MTNSNDNLFDPTLAEAISYLAFGQFLTADQLAAWRLLAAWKLPEIEPRSKEENAKLHELATNEERDRRLKVNVEMLADIRTVFADRSIEWISSPDLAVALHAMGHRPWPKYEGARNPINVRQIAQLLKPFGIAPTKPSGKSVKGYSTASFKDAFAHYLDNPLPHLLGKNALDWVWSLNKGSSLEFIPDHAAKIDGAGNRLLKGMIDEKVTGTGRLKIDDRPDDERDDIPSAFMRSGAVLDPLTDSIYEDISLPGNFGRLKRYRYVQINRAELMAFGRAENPPKARHELTVAEGDKGRQSPRQKVHVQSVINDIVTELTKTIDGTVGCKHVINHFIDNTSSACPKRTGVADCDYVFWDTKGERLHWRDRRNHTRSIGESSVSRYVTAAKRSLRPQ